MSRGCRAAGCAIGHQRSWRSKHEAVGEPPAGTWLLLPCVASQGNACTEIAALSVPGITPGAELERGHCGV